MNRVGEWRKALDVARRFRADLIPHRGRLLLALALSFLVAGLELLRPWPIKWIFDEALIPATQGLSGTWSPERVVIACVALLLLVTIVRAVAQYQREIVLAGVGHSFTRSLRFRIFSRLARLSPAYHARNKSGDLLMRLMGDAPMVTGMVVDSSVELLMRVALITGTIVMMLLIDPVLTLASLLTVPVLFFTVEWLSRQIRVAVQKQRRKEGTMADYLHESIAAVDTVQALGGSEHVIRRFARENRRTARAGLKAKRLMAKLSGSVETLMGIALAVVLALGCHRALSGIRQGLPEAERFTPGELLLFVSCVRNLIKPIRSASKHASRVSKGTACGERILEVLDEQDEVKSPEGAPPAPERPSVLTFENVSFTYEDGTVALVDFTARFRLGELSALVGRSGAGKSTAAMLASRMFDPDSGTVALDDQPLNELDLDSVRARVGVCLQRTVLFGDTLRENMLLARPDASEEDIWRALRDADAEDFVRDLPDALDAVLGSAGAGLSGGQQSRLSLARTLLKDAPVLLVDEPFAGLDRQAASKVARLLKRLAAERIVIVIAHDAEDMEDFDHIVFLDGGRVAGEGTHKDLVASIPQYARTVRSTTEAGR